MYYAKEQTTSSGIQKSNILQVAIDTTVQR